MDTQIDPRAINMAKAIRDQESGGNYTLPGKSGEYGAYQFTEPTWNAYAKDAGINTPLSKATREQQNEVIVKKINNWITTGKAKNVGEVASMWNAGEGKPQAYIENNVGTNKFGVHYDTPAYAKAVAQNYQKYKGQQTQTPDIQQPEQQTDPNAPDTYGATFKASSSDTPLQAGLKAVGNVPSSIANLAGGLFSAVTHPIKTVEGIGNTFAGGIEEGWNKLTGGKSSDTHTQTFDALKKSLYDRYGTLENAQRSATNDPAGVGADILSILEGGATLADKALGTTGVDIARTAAETGIKNFADTGLNVMPKVGLGKTSGLLNKGLGAVASRVTSGLGAVATAPIKAVGQTLGLETGVGYDPLKQGLKAASEGGDAMKSFTEGLRGNVGPDELVDQARNALGQVVETRNTNYKNMLSGLKADSATYDISPIVQQVDKKLKDFGVVKNTDGTLDFSRSTIGEGADATKIQQIYDDVHNWGTKPGDRTAVGIDTLKKRIGNYYSPNSDIRSFVTSTKKATSGVLENAPGYTSAMKNYAEMSDSISEIQKALSLGDKASVETSFKKLTSSLKNNEFRKQVIEGLDADTGGQLLNKIAGQRLSAITPRGLAGITAGGIGGITAVTAGAGGILPLIGLAITTSPRIVGEFIRALGLGVQATNKLMDLLNKFSTPAVMGGNINNRLNPGVMSKDELKNKIPGLFNGNIKQNY